MAKKSVMVTGAYGFIGTALVQRLKKQGYEVITFTSEEVNVTDKNLLDKFDWSEVRHIVHLAARTFVPDSWKEPGIFYDVNVGGTIHILEICRKYKISLTYISAYIYGVPQKNPIKENDSIAPNNPYSQSKYLAEQACEFYAANFNVDITILRPFNVYGGGQGSNFLIPCIINQALNEDMISVNNLEPKRDYIYIDDLLEAIELTIKNVQHYKVFNVGTGKSYSVEEVIRLVQQILGTNKLVESKGIFRTNELDDTSADISKIREELGWKPKYTLEEGLRKIIQQNNTPINKGNYMLETAEREAKFEKYRAKGWEEKYVAYRENWIRCAKEQVVLEYPLLVDIELSSLCNLKCPMCYTITDEFKNKVNAKLMDSLLFKKIIDEVALDVPSIRLSLRGEPTLHPKLVEFVKYAKQKGIGEISFLTNGSKLTKEYFMELMESGVDWITISIDGIGSTYEKIRKPLKFDDILEKVKTIKAVKDEKNAYKPVIKIQSVWPAIKENAEEFYNLFEPYVDAVAFNPLIDYLDNDEDIVYMDGFSCPQLYQRIVVGADGFVMMCSNDEENSNVIGNANNETIYQIWHGEKLETIRDQHKNICGYKNIPVCRKCYLPRKMVENEYANVNGRQIAVKNYINRVQKIGK